MESKYILRYLPLFEEDLREIVFYISHKLKNPEAADRLLDDVERAIKKRNILIEYKSKYPHSNSLIFSPSHFQKLIYTPP